MDKLTHCSHGKTYTEQCLECELISAQETIKHWKHIVEAAEKKIAQIQKTLRGE